MTGGEWLPLRRAFRGTLAVSAEAHPSIQGQVGSLLIVVLLGLKLVSFPVSES